VKGLHVLVVEDDYDLSANLVDYLEAKGHSTEVADNGPAGLQLAMTNDYDVIVLDLILPGLDGLSVCRRLREEAGRATPLLMLTARDQLDDKVAGLDAGADDYLVKPFSLRELEARLRALGRRGREPARPSNVLTVGDLVFDTGTMTVQRAGKRLELPPIPLRLLEMLMRASPQLVRREDLERGVWGDAPPDSDALRAHMHVLRAAIDRLGGPPLLHTQRGIGYRMAVSDVATP
jgi:DNA-binding response OmpR family regulator